MQYSCVSELNTLQKFLFPVLRPILYILPRGSTELNMYLKQNNNKELIIIYSKSADPGSPLLTSLS